MANPKNPLGQEPPQLRQRVIQPGEPRKGSLVRKAGGSNLSAEGGTSRSTSPPPNWRQKAKIKAQEDALEAAGDALAAHWAIQSTEPELMAALSPVMPRIAVAILTSALEPTTSGEAARQMLAKITNVPWGRGLQSGSVPAKAKAEAKVKLLDALTSRLSGQEASVASGASAAPRAPIEAVRHVAATPVLVPRQKLPF